MKKHMIVSNFTLSLVVLQEHSQRTSTIVWNEEEDSFFPHTDMMLSSFPVCMDWVGFDPGNEDDNRGNLLAVGTMEPQVCLSRN